MKHEEHLLWPSFLEWCEENGVDMEYEDDWKAWWDCYLAGSKAAIITFNLS